MFVTMGFSSIYVFTSELYPTEVRNVGVGVASMCARISGMAAPNVGGPLVSAFIFLYAYHIKCVKKRAAQNQVFFNFYVKAQ